MQNVDVLIKEIKVQIENPANAIVSSEAGFVCHRLRLAGFTELADSYWSYVCGTSSELRGNPEVEELTATLRAIEQKACANFPSWGTYGT